MKKLFYIIILIIFIFGNRIYSQKIQNQSDIIKSLANSTTIKLPYGDKNVLYKFPEKWDISRLTKQKKDKQNVDTDSVFNILNAFTYQDLEYSKRKSIVTQYPANKIFLEPDFIISDSVKKFNKNIEFRSLKVLSKTKFSLFSIMFKGDIDCNKCEFVEHQTQNVLLTIGKDNIIKDKLLISYINGSDLGQASRFFVIDTKEIIHQKSFKSDELGVTFTGYEKYQINENGNFIRYYEKNGNFKTDTELGFVKNNKRQGKWIEIKENKYLYNWVKSQKDKKDYPDYYTYMEANYKDGLAIGEAKFFKLIQKYDQNGQPILSSRKKGKLIYTETFDNGKIKDRKFLK
ncbi:hypothetical protein [Flavobacterium sp.]|uniref:hypothetical protein n=1 Tax=Flavobacterium sp. TaxID=239 RepID=UPI00286BCB93|nr:hypothetical protein [Flavobacterium sp.]